MAKYYYPAAAVKVMNERFRKLESVHMDASGRSYAETGMSHYYNRLKNIIVGGGDAARYYNPKTTSVDIMTGKTKIRFLNKTQFEALPEEAKKEFIAIVRGSLKAPTSTKRGIIATEKKAQENFMSKYDWALQRVPESEREEMARRMREGMNQFFADKKDHFVYDKRTWDLLLNNYDMYGFFVENRETHSATWENIFLKSYEYALSNQWSKIPKKYIHKNY